MQCVRIPGGAVDNGAVAAWLRSSARTSRLRKRSTISLTTVISVARPTLTTSACGSSSSSSSSCALMDLCRTGIKPMHCDEQIARAMMHASRAHRDGRPTDYEPQWLRGKGWLVQIGVYARACVLV